jgi:hypothetical protein
MRYRYEYRLELYERSATTSPHDVVTICNKCGADGWELVMISPWSATHQVSFLFKRRVVDGKPIPAGEESYP